MSWADQRQVEEGLAAYRAWALEPSGLVLAGVDSGPAEAEGEGIRGTAEVLLAEDQAWNQWGDDQAPLLFNDRGVLLFEVDLAVPGEARWVPEATTVEVNAPENLRRAAASPEEVLAELIWHALQQEKWVLDGDLVQRTRHAGAFREAFVRLEDGRLHGLIAFPRGEAPEDIGALRLTVAVMVDRELEKVEWVFQ